MQSLNILSIIVSFATDTDFGGMDNVSPPLVNLPLHILPKGVASNTYLLSVSTTFSPSSFTFVTSIKSILKLSIIATTTYSSSSEFSSLISKYEPTLSLSSAVFQLSIL